MLIQGDARSIPLADKSVQCVVTSPPYWGLRDYGTAKWEGGDQACDHRPSTLHATRNENRPTYGDSYATNNTQLLAIGKRTSCDKCGAVKTDNQLGLEATPAAYVENVVAVFRELRRVLRDDGTVWLNLGDSYAANSKGSGGTGKGTIGSGKGQGTNAGSFYETTKFALNDCGLKAKDLVGIPWRVAFALQADGWYLRSDIIWQKPNPMPESVTDRPTRSHEYVFLLTKSERYYYDHEAIKEPYAASTLREAKEGYTGQATKDYAASLAQNPSDTKRRIIEAVNKGGGRNCRSVWTITTKPFKGAHFATFPPELPERCIRAGSKVGDVVFDPFSGAGTTVMVAERLGRVGIGLELKPDYIAIAEKRLNDQSPLCLAPSCIALPGRSGYCPVHATRKPCPPKPSSPRECSLPFDSDGLTPSSGKSTTAPPEASPTPIS